MSDDATTLLGILLVIGSFIYILISLISIFTGKRRNGQRMLIGGVISFVVSFSLLITWIIVFSLEHNLV